MVQKIEIQAMAVVFVERKHILLEDMINAAIQYFFACLPIGIGEKKVTKKIVSLMNKDNMQIRKKRNLFAFYKVDLPLL